MLLLEYRGYGENKGKPSKLGLYRDGEAAINYLINQKIKSKNIIVYGESLGTAIATKLSTNYSFNMTILEAPFTSVADVAQKRYWIFPAKYLVLDNFDILGIIKKIKSPLLLLHGYKDYVINIAFGKKVFEVAPKPKKALFVQNAGHNNLFEFNLVSKILNFLKKY